jgi:hypothetical protein
MEKNRNAQLLYQKLCEKGIDKVSLSLINPNFVQNLNNDQQTKEELPSCVTQKYMKFVCQILSPDHLYQVVEERNIGRLCGNPTCPQILDEQMLQQVEEEKKKRGRFHIDLKNRKVYDRSQETEHYYCSAKCKHETRSQVDSCETTAPYARDCL